MKKTKNIFDIRFTKMKAGQLRRVTDQLLNAYIYRNGKKFQSTFADNVCINKGSTILVIDTVKNLNTDYYWTIFCYQSRLYFEVTYYIEANTVEIKCPARSCI
jgi:hypothetical protein